MSSHTIRSAQTRVANGVRGQCRERHADATGFGTVLDVLTSDEQQPQWTCLQLPEAMPFDAWWRVGARVFHLARCSAWWIGDWLVYGEDAYGDRYHQATVSLELDYQTLRNYAWVARKFTVSRRRDRLSFGHHAEVAALPPAEQDLLLDKAEQQHWSRNVLRQKIHARRAAARRGSRTAQPRMRRIEVPAEQHLGWVIAARQSNHNLTDWIIETLDRAAGETQEQ